jgi:hypothetical protein
VPLGSDARFAFGGAQFTSAYLQQLCLAMRRCADTRAQTAIKSAAERAPPQALSSVVSEAAAAGQLGAGGAPSSAHVLDILLDAFNFHNSAPPRPPPSLLAAAHNR